MHGLIWGIVRFQPADSLNAEIEELSACVANHARVGDALVKTDGEAALAQANLEPTGQTTCPPTPIFQTEDASFVCEGRLFDGGQTTDICKAFAGGSLNAIEGDFACAMWKPAEKKLVLARDLSGTRPLFFAHRSGEFAAFCSLAGPLIDAGFASEARDDIAMVQLVTARRNEGERTLLRDIKRVDAAHTTEITSSSSRHRRYWSIDVGTQSIAPDEAAGKLRKLLSKAVAKRLPKDGPVASEISGGLDSTSITCIAAGDLAEQQRDVIGFFIEAPQHEDIPPVDAARDIDAVRQRHANLTVRKVQPLSVGRRMFGTYRADLSGLKDGDGHQAEIYEQASKDGARILLSGFGGDETASFGGAGTIYEALSGLRFKELRELLQNSTEFEDSPPPWKLLAAEILSNAVPASIASKVRRAAGARETADDVLKAYLTPEGQALLRPKARAKSVRHRKLIEGRLAHAAESLATQAAAHGMALSFPFLDRDLMNFTTTLPGTVFRRNGQSRWLIREAMIDILPEMTRTSKRRFYGNNTFLLSLCERKAELLAEVERMKSTDAARIFNLDLLALEISDLPSPKDAYEVAKAKGEDDESPDQYQARFYSVFILARHFADAASAPYGARREID